MSSERTVVTVLFLAVVSVLLAVVFSRYGPGLTPDSQAYLEGADSVLSGDGYVFRGEPIALWPPIFSLSIALTSSIPAVDFGWAVFIVNLFAYGGIVVLAARWLFLLVDNRWLRIFGIAAVAFSPPILEVSAHAWSESLFMLLALFSLDRAAAALNSESVTRSGVAGLLAAGATLTRYIGATVVLSGLTGLLLFGRRDAVRRLQKVAVFGVAAAVPVAIWLLRNVLAADTLTGPRAAPAGDVSIDRIVGIAALNAGKWFFPSSMPAAAIALGFSAVALGAGLLFVSFLRSEPRKELTPLLGMLGVFIVTYGAALMASALGTAIDLPGDRFLSPLYAPFVVALAYVVDRLAASLTSERNWLAWSLVLFVAIGIASVPVFRSTGFAIEAMNNGAGGYATDQYRESEFVRLLNDWSPESNKAVLYSNDPWAVYFVAPHLEARPSAQRTRFASSDPADFRLPDMRDAVAGDAGTNYLIWFEQRERQRFYSPEEIRSTFVLERVFSAEDGAVYRISPRSSP